MTDTITRNSTVPVALTFALPIEYKAGYKSETILHPKLHGPGYNVTYRPVRDRAGTLSLLFSTSAEAFAAIAYLRTPYTFTWSSDVTDASMTFVIADGTLEPVTTDGRRTWVVVVPYQELV